MDKEMELMIMRRMVRGAGILGGFAADAHAMPVHWFYSPEDIPKYYGEKGIKRNKFVAPQLKTKHPLHISYPGWMSLDDEEGKAKTGGKQLVGEIILRRTGSAWGPQQSHPHCTLPAGGTTTNANVCRLMMRYLASKKGAGYDKKEWLKVFVDFMMDPQQKENDDAYVEGYHRNFFKKLAGGAAPDECADTDEGSASIGSLATFPPLIIYELSRDGDVARVKKVAREHLWTCAPHESMAVVVEALVDLVDALAFKRPMKEGKEDDDYCLAALAAALKVQGHDLDELLKIGAEKDTDVVGGKLGASCGIEHSWGCALFLVAKYALKDMDGAVDAIFANTKAGGENVHRGFFVGFLATMVNPKSDLLMDEEDGLVEQLAWVRKIEAESEALINANATAEEME